MALLKIARMGHPILRHRAQPIDPSEIPAPAFQQFIDDMTDTMRDGDGVGLAAPQVHDDRHVFLVEVRGSNPRYPDEAGIPLTVFINPEITSHSEELEEDWEGCLSIPDLRGRVPRWNNLHLRALDRHAKPFELDASDFFARIIQHELDHLDGVLFLDRMREFSTLTFMREFQRYWLPIASPK